MGINEYLINLGSKARHTNTDSVYTQFFYASWKNNNTFAIYIAFLNISLIQAL